MKYLFITMIMLISVLAFGSGKLSIEPNYFFQAKHLGAKGGLAIDQPLFFNLHYQQWTGAGYTPQEGNYRMMWATSNHDLVYYFHKSSVAAGGSVTYGDENFGEGFKRADYNVHVKYSYELW